MRYLGYNQLTTLPEGSFAGLGNLQSLDLQGNHLMGLTKDDPLFSGLMASIDLRYQSETEGGGEGGGGTETEPRLVAVPLMLSASHSSGQGFVRVVNQSDEAGVVRVFAVDDGDHAPDPFEIELETKQTLHFNSDDLQDGNADKGIEGVGAPVQGDWRLDIETTLSVRVLAFVRASDGFLTAMHDVLPELPKDEDGRRVAMTFNPGGNTGQASKLRLVNTGDSDETATKGS